MLRVSVTANDSLLVDVLASILVVETDIHPDVLQLYYHLPRNFYGNLLDPRSIVIVIDEGESENEQIKTPVSFLNHGPLLLIRASLRTMNVDLYECYQLARPGMEEVIRLITDFCRSQFKNREETLTLFFTSSIER